MSLNEIFSSQLKVLRTDKLMMTQEELAKKLAVERSTLSKIENGQNDVSLSFIQKVVDNTDIELPELFKITASNFSVVNHKDNILTAQGINTTFSINIPPEMVEQLVAILAMVTKNKKG
jgi:transcriptional regulator with XRE-family HTH domain